MASYAYIVLANSSGSGGKRYRVPMGYYKPVLFRNQSIEETVGGTLDIAQGANFERHEYALWVRQTEADSNYGTLGELKALWQLNNPNGTPSDRITLTDHFGTNHTVVFQGEFSQQAMTTIIEGTEAWYMVPVILRFV